MSVKLDITLKNRGKITHGKLNKLKKQDIIPAVIYGKNFDTLSVFVDRKKLVKMLIDSKEEHVFFNVKIEGSKDIFNAVIQEKQWDVIKQEIKHIDFKKINLNEKIKLYSEFKFLGTPKGVKQGGVLEIRYTKVKGECLPMNFPKFLEIDITKLDIGEGLKMKDVKLPDGLKVDLDPETILVFIAKHKKERNIQESEHGGQQTAEQSATNAKTNTKNTKQTLSSDKNDIKNKK